RDLRLHRIEIGGAILRDQAARFIRARRLAEEEDDLDAAVWRQVNPRAHRAARIEARSDFVGERRWAGERRWIGERSIAADELPAICGPVRLTPAQIGEGDARSK